jgi:hypothetical protein
MASLFFLLVKTPGGESLLKGLPRAEQICDTANPVGRVEQLGNPGPKDPTATRLNQTLTNL